MRALFAFMAAAIFLSPQQRGYSPVQDGEAHGDPPYLLEDGWEPLLDGADLAGWKACDSAAKNEWYTAKAVRFESHLVPPSCTDVRARVGRCSTSTEPMTTSDGGAIYHRWIDERGVGGSAPLANAARRPGEWQSYQIWFRAPRFDPAGKKTEPAQFVRVLFNGHLVQKDVVVEGRHARCTVDSGSSSTSFDAAGRSWTSCIQEHLRAAAPVPYPSVATPSFSLFALPFSLAKPSPNRIVIV